MIDFGIVRPGTTLYIPFATYDSNDPSASVTLTGLATTDVEIYKDGSVTQRASDAGVALLDTDGIDFDATTGIHGFSIDLADNTTAGFYASGSQYFVVVASVTVDAATINFIAATFRIGYPSALLNTTIATLASQTSFTLTVGPAEDDALNGMEVMIHDVASAVQCGRAVILDYTGSTKTVTLAAGTTFTAAATDNIAIIGPSPLMPITAGRQVVIDAAGLADANMVKTGPTGSGTAQTAGDIIGDTNDIQTRLPAALTADGNIKADTLRISGTTQTAGDIFARLGAPAGASMSADIAALLVAITAVDDFLDTEIAAILTDTGTDIPALIAALNNLSAAQVNTEVLDAMAVDTHAQPGQGTPAATTSYSLMLRYLYKWARNKRDNTGTVSQFYNDDATTVDHKQTTAESGGTVTVGEMATGP